jgi:hypothetical protein
MRATEALAPTTQSVLRASEALAHIKHFYLIPPLKKTSLKGRRKFYKGAILMFSILNSKQPTVSQTIRKTQKIHNC